MAKEKSKLILKERYHYPHCDNVQDQEDIDAQRCWYCEKRIIK